MTFHDLATCLANLSYDGIFTHVQPSISSSGVQINVAS